MGPSKYLGTAAFLCLDPSTCIVSVWGCSSWRHVYHQAASLPSLLKRIWEDSMHCRRLLRNLLPPPLPSARRAQPVLSHISLPSLRPSRSMSSKPESSGFVLDEYNHVPVAASGLDKDQLKEWGPFKVRTVVTIPFQAFHAHTDTRITRDRTGSPPSPNPSPSSRNPPTLSTRTPTRSRTSPSTPSPCSARESASSS